MIRTFIDAGVLIYAARSQVILSQDMNESQVLKVLFQKQFGNSNRSVNICLSDQFPFGIVSMVVRLLS
jgi:hypothetical protein